MVAARRLNDFPVRLYVAVMGVALSWLARKAVGHVKKMGQQVPRRLVTSLF